MISTDYDPEADVLHVRFGARSAQYDGAEEIAPGVYLEFDAAGTPIGIEITGVHKRVAEAPAAKPAAAE